MGSIGIRVSAADRSRMGGNLSRSQEGQRGNTGTGTGTMRRRCARLQTLEYRTLSELLSFGLVAVLEGSYLEHRTYPLQKGVLKDIISLGGCNSPVV